MSISAALLPEFDEEMKNTRKMLERVPADKLTYKPHEKSMSLGRLAGHIAELPSWAKHTLELEVLELKAGQKPFDPASVSELLEMFDKHVPEARELLSKATNEDLARIWTLKFDGNAVLSMPRSAILRTVVMNHMIHHRAQLGVYLRLNELEIPGMYGPSADEMKFWNPQAQSA